MGKRSRKKHDIEIEIVRGKEGEIMRDVIIVVVKMWSSSS